MELPITYPIYCIDDGIYMKIVGKDLLISAAVEDRQNVSGISVIQTEIDIIDIIESAVPITEEEFESKLKLAKKALTDAGIF